MLFDQGGELPVATVRSTRSPVEGFARELARWFTARWQWFKPRTIPVTVAFLGMVGVIQAVNYLAHPPAAHTASASVRVTNDAPGAMIFVDGKPYLDGAPMPDLQGTQYRVRLVLEQ